MGRASTTLLLLACVGMGLTGALLGEGTRAPEPDPSPVDTSLSPKVVVRLRLPEHDVAPPAPPRFRRKEPAPPPLPKDPDFANAEVYVLREYVDMSGRFSSLSVRLIGELRLDPASRRVSIVLRADPLLRGNEVFGSKVLSARGSWMREGDQLTVEGLDLANDERDIFEPRGATKRWRVEKEGAAVLIRAGPLTFERRGTP